MAESLMNRYRINLSNEYGSIGEKVAKKWLEENGYEVYSYEDRSIIVARSGDGEMREISKNYVKSEVALWMQLHLENGLMLTHVRNGER